MTDGLCDGDGSCCDGEVGEGDRMGNCGDGDLSGAGERWGDAGGTTGDARVDDDGVPTTAAVAFDDPGEK